jgi:hypothetical protein
MLIASIPLNDEILAAPIRNALKKLFRPPTILRACTRTAANNFVMKAKTFYCVEIQKKINTLNASQFVFHFIFFSFFPELQVVFQ